MNMTEVPLGIFWDLENCQLPCDKSALTFVQHLRSKFSSRGSEVEFTCVCDVYKEKIEIIDQLNDAQVSVVHVSSCVKNAADDKLKACLQRFGQRHKSPASVILISGDVNFSGVLHDLRYRCCLFVIVLHGWPVQDGLLATANEHFRFQQLLQDVPSQVINPQSSKRRCCYVRVSGLPIEIAPGRVKTRLRQMSDNLGGRVLELRRNGTAVLQFASPEATIRAEKRMHNELVFGRNITASASPNSPAPIKHTTTMPQCMTSVPMGIGQPAPQVMPVHLLPPSSFNMPPPVFAPVSVPRTCSPYFMPIQPLPSMSEPLVESDTSESVSDMATSGQKQVMAHKLKQLLKSPSLHSDSSGPPQIRAYPGTANVPPMEFRQSVRHRRSVDESEPVDVRVENLIVSNGHVRDMKKLLWTKFAQFVQVRHVTIIPQTNGKWYALVQVANMHNARKAVQAMDSQKVNMSRVSVSVEDAPPVAVVSNTRVSLRDEVIGLLNHLPSKCIQLRKLIQLLKCTHEEPLSLKDLFQMRDAVRLAENQAGVCFVRLATKFYAEETPEPETAPVTSQCFEGDPELSDQLVELMLVSNQESLPLDDLDIMFNARFKHRLPLATMQVRTVRELVNSMPSTLKLMRGANGRTMVCLSECRQKSLKAQKIFYLFLRKPELELTPENFIRIFRSEFDTDCDPDKLKDEFPDLLTWRQKLGGILLLGLSDLQQFAIRSRRVLNEFSTRDVPLPIYQAEYRQKYGVTICPQKFGYPTMIGLIRAASHVLYLKGRGTRCTITINRNFLSSLQCIKDLHIRATPTPRAQSLLSRHRWASQSGGWDEDVPSGLDELDDETKTQLGFVFKKNYVTRGSSRNRGGGHAAVFRRKPSSVTPGKLHTEPKLITSHHSTQSDDSLNNHNEPMSPVELEDMMSVVMEEVNCDEIVAMDEMEISGRSELIPPHYFDASPMKDSGLGSGVDGPSDDEPIIRGPSRASSVSSMRGRCRLALKFSTAI